jgi:hypothetical protein
VAFLLAGLQFNANLAVDGVLRVDEALQVVVVGGRCPAEMLSLMGGL